MSRRSKGYLIAGMGIAFWSTTGVIMSHLFTQYGISVLLLQFWRNTLVCVALIPTLYLLKRSLLHLNATQIGFYVLYGLVLALFNLIWALSVRTNGAAVGTVLGFSSAGFTVLIAWWLFREPLGVAKILAVILSLTGCVMVSNAYRAEMWKLNPVGVLTGLFSGLLFAGYNLMGKEAARRKLSAWTCLLYSFALSAAFLLLFNHVPALSRTAGSPGVFVPSMPLRGWLILIAFSFIPTLFGFGLFNLSLNYLPAGVASLLATAEPVMTTTLAYVFLHERMTLVQIVGGLIILSAVLLVRGEKGTSH